MCALMVETSGWNGTNEPSHWNFQAERGHAQLVQRDLTIKLINCPPDPQDKNLVTMVAIPPCTKHNISNTRGATIPTPFLLSPISVAHWVSSDCSAIYRESCKQSRIHQEQKKRQMLDSETGRYSSGNAIRDQWVANLQNKRMAAAAGTGDPIGSGNWLAPSSSSTTANSSSKGGSAKKSTRSRSAASRAAAKSRNAAQLSAAVLEKCLNSCQRNVHRHRQFKTMPSNLIVDTQIAMSDTDAKTLEQSSMLLDGMGCFELEPPSFSRVISTSLDEDFSLSSLVTPASTMKKSKGWPKRGTRAGSKKRATHCLALHADQPKPHIPRRKLDCGSVKPNSVDLDYYSVVSNVSGFCDAEAPSSISVDASCANTRYLWGQDIDFSGAEEYADTFLDSPTLQLAEMPLMSTLQRSNISSTTDDSSEQANDEQDVPPKFDHPPSVRTSSFEQEGFSHFLEQINLDGIDGGHDDELSQLATTPLISACTSTFSGGSGFTAATAAAIVDECFGGKLATLSSSWQMPSPPRVSSSSRPDAAVAWRSVTPQDQKHPPAFETLIDEYKFTDIYYGLDDFYLDALEE